MPRAVTKDRVSLFYKDWGPADGRPIVLIHGWPLTGDTFDDVAVELAKDGFRSIIPDRRGFGRSDQHWDGYDYDTFASDIEAVLDDAGIEGRIALAGFSMGGGEVARLVARHGDRVSHAILIGSIVPFMLQTDDNPKGVPQEIFDQMAGGIAEDRAAFFKAFAKDFYGAGAVSEAVLDDAGIEGRIALAGFSMGGGEVARLVARHGDRVSHAILIGSIVPFMLQTDDNPKGVPQEIFDQMAGGIAEDRAAFFKAFAKDFYGAGAVSEAVLDDFQRQAMMAGLRPTLAAAQAFATTDFRGDLRHFTMPTLVIHGTKDATVPIDTTAREVRAALPHAQLLEYDGSAHGLLATDKKRLVDDIRAFLSTGR